MKKTVTVGVYTIIMSKIHHLSQVAAFIFLLVALSSFLLVYAPLRSINGDKQNLMALCQVVLLAIKSIGEKVIL